MTKTNIKVWVKPGRTKYSPRTVYTRTDYDRPSEWKGLKRGILTIEPPKSRKKRSKQ